MRNVDKQKMIKRKREPYFPVSTGFKFQQLAVVLLPIPPFLLPPPALPLPLGINYWSVVNLPLTRPESGSRYTL